MNVPPSTGPDLGKEIIIATPNPRPTLQDHRRRLSRIEPDGAELARLAKTLSGHLVKMGSRRVREALRRDIVTSIFSTQDYKPFFWTEGALPFCWNDPKDWDKDYIKYQWGHLNPRNSIADGTGKVEDLCLMSARCNNHIQSSLPIADLQEYFRGSATGLRIQRVLEKRNALFASTDWQRIMSELDNCTALQTLKGSCQAGGGTGQYLNTAPPDAVVFTVVRSARHGARAASR
jgi:hypothetical protein